MRRGLLVGALVLAAAGAFGEAPALTLTTAVSEALAHGLDQVTQEANARANQAQYQKTIASAGPTVALTGGVSGSADTGSTTAQTGTVGATLALGSSSLKVTGSQTTESTRAVTVALTQNLWDGYLGGQTAGTAAEAVLEQKAAALTADAATRTLVQSVKTAYYTLLSAQENLITLASTLDQANRSLALVQARYDNKQASVIDLQTAKIAQRTAEVDQQQGQNTLRNAQLALAHLMGRQDAAFTVAETEEPAPTVTTLDEAQAYARAHRYERTTTALAVEAARVALDLAKAAQQPTVDLTAGANQAATKAASTTTFTLGVSASWSAWDSGVSTQAVVRQQALVDAAEATRQAQDLTIQREVDAAWSNWKLMAAKAELAQMTVDKDNAALAVARAQYEAGNLTNTLLLEAQTDAMDAQTALASATINLRLAVLTLKTALGTEE